MILSTWGASAAGFQTTSFAARAAWARRTSHHGAVVLTTAVAPAAFRISRRVCMSALSFHSAERQSLDDPALEDEEHEHRRQGAHYGRGHEGPPEEHVLRHEVHEAGGDGPGAGGAGEDVGVQELVPRVREREERHHDERRQ